MLLTSDELRAMMPGLPTGDDADNVIQMLLDATEVDIIEWAGPTGSRDEYVSECRGYPTLIVSQPIASVAAITEDPYGTPLVLASDDYRFSVDGYVIRRLTSGTNARYAWPPEVRVQYTTPDDIERRSMVQLGLCKLVTAYAPGLLSMRVGEWAESYQSTSRESGYSTERDALLATLSAGPSMVVL